MCNTSLESLSIQLAKIVNIILEFGRFALLVESKVENKCLGFSLY